VIWSACIACVAIKLLSAKWREVHPLMYAAAAVFAAFFSSVELVPNGQTRFASFRCVGWIFRRVRALDPALRWLGSTGADLNSRGADPFENQGF